MKDMEEIRGKLKDRIMGQLPMDKEVDDDQVRELIDSALVAEGRSLGLTFEEKRELSRDLFYTIRRMDILQEILENKAISEVMINGYTAIFVERAGRLVRWEKSFSSDEKLEDVIQQIVAGCNRTVNEASPIVDARLENGSRVNVVLAPVALNGPIVTIRRFPEKPMQMEDLKRFGAITQEVIDFLKQLVVAGYNIFISGGTGSGKTTFLNALSNFIPKDERIITIEDSAELQIQGVPNLVRLETRNANVEGCKEITMRDLIKSSLRMRPDRIVVGEVRGSEALDMVQAMNTGHDGSLSTGHANSAEDMLSRLETMILMGMDLPLSAIRGQLASGIDVIVHLGRLRDKSRKVLQVVEILGYKDDVIETNVLYEFEEEGEDEQGRILGSLKKRNPLEHEEKLRAAGL